MKLARLGPVGAEIPALVTDSATYDLRGVTADIDGAFLAGDGVARVRAAAEAGSLPELAGAADLRAGAPVARPAAVIAIGLNYVAHAAEAGAKPPKNPVVFLKTPNTVGGPDDDVAMPRHAEARTDYEVELGVVIGARTAFLGSPADSLAQIAGFVVADDVSERYAQGDISGGQWSKGKCFPGFCPTGPWLVTPDEVDHNNLRLRSWVNGEPRQDSSTSDMIFNVEFLIHHVSQFMTLEPGDLVITGTPQGVAHGGKFPFLKAGDVVEMEIEGLGRQKHAMVDR